jgi:hypothetical protein
MTPSAPTTPLRQVLDERISELLREAEGMFEARLASQTAETRLRAQRDTADRLNQAVRRMTQAAGAGELAATLLDASGPFATAAALLRVDGGMATVERIRGHAEACRTGVAIPLSQASALAGAVETRDPVVAMASAAEISPALAALFPEGVEGRLSIFPLAAGERVVALLCAWGEVEGPPLELLAQVAGAMWRGHGPAAPAGLLSIASAATRQPGEPASKWEGLPPAEQQMHLRAQRFARVQTAGMRLHQGGAVRAGRARCDLYDALRKPIEDAREAFRKEFFASCPSMVDYLHLELVHTLANDDPELLGKDYPGPML